MSETDTKTETPLQDFGWALLELMGHRQRVGQVREVEIAGSKMLRIDCPVDGEDVVTEFYGGSSVYALRPMTEEMVRNEAKWYDPRPVRPCDYKPPDPVQQITVDDVQEKAEELADDDIPF